MKLASSVVLLVALGTPAHAGPTTTRVALATCDLGGDALFVAGLLTNAPEHENLSLGIMLGGIVIGGLGAPLVDVAEDHWARAGISLGAHVLLPIIGGAIVESAATKRPGLDGLGDEIGAELEGGLLGQVAATAIDLAMTIGDRDAPRVVALGGRF